MVPTAELVGEIGDVNASVSREFSEMDSILSVHRDVSSQDGNHNERNYSSSSKVIGATEEEYDASESSSDHGSVSVECGSNVGLDDNHSTADDEGGVNEEEKPATATAAAPEADDTSADGAIAETPEPERVVLLLLSDDV
ncbi:hypothetical protein PsorP6_005172 [Peronosclerospora sorghi]|uniref:Uncharacterized protein n=1 Tax=Peronosclerospora sorghi TaxID=230839 RepID=A0ACC0W4K3_9STRA|nr:hypothetical protein PsorP6_005172 [Peronosclerospora sorghi]